MTTEEIIKRIGCCAHGYTSIFDCSHCVLIALKIKAKTIDKEAS